ncbi:hypothetical protein MICAI_1980030 [Microcystis sp. T1-4]|nr:hypothetical protein MICAI_1980030 [Microcystis sp. T1-4]
MTHIAPGVLITLIFELEQRLFKYAPTYNLSHLTINYTETFRITKVGIYGNFRHITPFCRFLTIS